MTVLQIAALKKVKKSSRILLLDKNGGQAKDIARELAARGYKKVFVISGGFSGWTSSKLQTKGSSSVRPPSLAAAPCRGDSAALAGSAFGAAARELCKEVVGGNRPRGCCGSGSWWHWSAERPMPWAVAAKRHRAAWARSSGAQLEGGRLQVSAVEVLGPVFGTRGTRGTRSSSPGRSDRPPTRVGACPRRQPRCFCTAADAKAEAGSASAVQFASWERRGGMRFSGCCCRRLACD